MSLLTANTALSRAQESHPTLIPLVARFGIRLGQGDRSIEAVCREHGIDPDFMLTVMNTYLFDEYFPEQKFKSFHMEQIIDYLTKTNAYYLHQQLPNIERHLGSLISTSSSNRNLELIGQFFGKFKENLQSSIAYDTEQWFPYCLSLGRGERPRDIPATHVEASLLATDLRSIMVRHLQGEYNDNLAYAVIFAIASLERDISQHNRIRQLLLNPSVKALCPAE